MLGEVTPEMALAISQSKAKRILIPVNHCDNCRVEALCKEIHTNASD